MLLTAADVLQTAACVAPIAATVLPKTDAMLQTADAVLPTAAVRGGPSRCCAAHISCCGAPQQLLRCSATVAAVLPYASALLQTSASELPTADMVLPYTADTVLSSGAPNSCMQCSQRLLW